MSTHNLHKDVYSGFIPNRQNPEATTDVLRKVMDSYTVLHPDNGILLSPKQK